MPLGAVTRVLASGAPWQVHGCVGAWHTAFDRDFLGGGYPGNDDAHSLHYKFLPTDPYDFFG